MLCLGIKINMVKQVHHKVYFAKEIKLGGKTEVLEVKYGRSVLITNIINDILIRFVFSK